MSACIGFSTCRIQFIRNDQPRAERNYSDRSLIELRQHDFANFTLRALDIDNNKVVIFEIPLENEDQYKRGKSSAIPDEIRNSAGTYRLWLNADSRVQFYEALNLSIEEIKLLGPEPSQTSTAARDVMTITNSRHDDEQPKTRTRQDDEPPKSYSRYDNEPLKTRTRQDNEPPKSYSRYDDEQPKPRTRQDNEPPKSYSRYDDEQPKPRTRQDDEPPKSYSRYDNEPLKTRTRQDDEQPKTRTRQDDEPLKSYSRHDNELPKPRTRQDDEPPKTRTRQDDEQPKTRTRQDDEQPKTKTRQDDEQPKSTRQSNQNDILADVYQLGQHIRQGNIDAAVDLAKKLSETRVRLQANLRKEHNEEKPIQIRVRIDSNDNRISRRHTADLTMGVYPSTTIRDLRTAFEYSDDFPPSNQYFFVNGHLAHESSTMSELNIRPDSLFVLFVIQQ